jgi:hypothetical protein
MVGTTYFVRWLLDQRLEAAGKAAGPGGLPLLTGADWTSFIPNDSLKPVSRHIALRMPYYALANRLRLGFGLPPILDRGIVLERTWDRLYEAAFGDLRHFEALGRIPSLVFSPMTIEDGRRLLVTNLDLGHLPVTVGGQLADDNDGSKQTPFSLSALEFSKAAPWDIGPVRLSTAVRMSASFPYVSPAASLPSHPRLRVLDAGYYDNYGVSVAVAWLVKNRTWLEDHTSGVVLVQIRDALSGDDRFGYPDDPNGVLQNAWSWLQFVHSPPDGLLEARYTSSSFRNDQEVTLLRDLFAVRRGPRFFTTAVFENSANVTRLHQQTPWPGDDLDGVFHLVGGLADQGPPVPKAVEKARERAAEVAAAGAPVAMNWYVSAAEAEAMLFAIPTDPSWTGPENRAKRLKRIEGLKQFLEGKVANRALDPAEMRQFRTYAIRELARAVNYERIAALKEWWLVDHH